MAMLETETEEGERVEMAMQRQRRVRGYRDRGG